MTWVSLLGCGATLTHLTRDSIGKFELADSIHADDIEKIADGIERNADGTKKMPVILKKMLYLKTSRCSESVDGRIWKKISDGKERKALPAGILSVEKILQLKYL